MTTEVDLHNPCVWCMRPRDNSASKICRSCEAQETARIVREGQQALERLGGGCWHNWKVVEMPDGTVVES